MFPRRLASLPIFCRCREVAVAASGKRRLTAIFSSSKTRSSLMHESSLITRLFAHRQSYSRLLIVKVAGFVVMVTNPA
jgi:hypothetical protein